MKDNIYPYAIDCGIMKRKGDSESEIVIFEIQPFLYSALGALNWDYNNGFQKKFPNFYIEIGDLSGKLFPNIKIGSADSLDRILIRIFEDLSDDDRIKIERGYYKYVHTPLDEKEVNKLNDKLNQRLYLPEEVSPEYCILESNLERDSLVEEIFNYFNKRSISKIVLKKTDGIRGNANIFIDDINNKSLLRNGIEKICQCHPKYFLAEEQKIFPRISRKTGEKKPDYLSYRIIGIANDKGNLGHFIATKSISKGIDSHKRDRMKCYFDQPGKKHHEKGKWLFEACGPKDKYYGEGKDAITINPELMDKISKHICQLYTDIKTMSDEDFDQHIARLVLDKRTLNSTEEKIICFTTKDNANIRFGNQI